MATEENFILTTTTENSSEVRTPPYPPLCYELKLVPPVIYQSRALRIEFRNYYVNEISIRAIFERDDATHYFVLVDSYSLMPNCHTEQGSHDRFDIALELPESSINLCKIQIFCYQLSQNWCSWRLNNIKLFSITESILQVKSKVDIEHEDTNDTVKLIKSLTSVLQDNITSSNRTDNIDTNTKLTPPITGPCYNIQLLLCDQ
ncbi:hypothetical protein LOD99_13658 [Oopsacas minuta]|uniref:CBM21 domain-containing protein n=1 Tax=Oopsacas minuta TaxID=111878 RepID=A0AAV7KL99_9METZ|nr:hypothetical protein LOD99_13658 [Oopsacas minuta]